MLYLFKNTALTIHHYFIYHIRHASNIQYNQPRILNYILVLIRAYFTHCSQSTPEAVITAVPAPDDGCQHLKHVELPTDM